MSWQTQQTKKELVAKNKTRKSLPKYEEGKKIRGGGHNYANMEQPMFERGQRNVNTLDK